MTVRRTEVSDEVKDRTEALFHKLTKFDNRLSKAEVVFAEEGHSTTVEGVLTIDRDDQVFAKAEASDAQSAVDQLVDKLAKILRRRRSQLRSQRGRRPEPADTEIG